jgi:hypothetical protein
MGSVPSGVDLTLIDESDRELACTPLCYNIGHAVPPRPRGWKPSDGVGCSPFVATSFSAEVPARQGGAALVIRRGSVVLWTQRINQSWPTVLLQSCETVGDIVRVTWSCESAANTRPRIGVEFSLRGRLEDWRSVANRSDADDPSTTDFDLIQLPPGRVMIRLVLDDGFYMTPSNVVELDVPVHPLEIEISTPVAAVVPEGLGKLSVKAVAREWRGHGPFDAGEIHNADAYDWMLDDVSLGRGKTILFDPPPLGSHTLTARVKSKDREARASLAFAMTDELLGAIEAERPRITAMRELFPHLEGDTPTLPPPRPVGSRLLQFVLDLFSRDRD